MKYFYFVLFSVLINSCIDYNDTYREDYKSQLDIYKLNDTLFFESNNKDLDTFKISRFDSLSNESISINAGLFKSNSIKINHLPNNNWYRSVVYFDA
jgi:hypothetical protein